MSYVENGVKDRRYFYITFLRHPVDRYLSEWKHVYRGATWKTAELKCGGVAWGEVMPKCYGDEEVGSIFFILRSLKNKHLALRSREAKTLEKCFRTL